MRISHISANLGKKQLVSQLQLDLAARRIYTCIFVYAKNSSECFNTALYFNGKINRAAVVMRFWPSYIERLESEKNRAYIFTTWSGSCRDLISKISERKEIFGHIALRMIVQENYKGTPLTVTSALAWAGFPEIDDFLEQAISKERPKRRGKNKYDPYKDANQPLLPWPTKE